MIYSSSMEYAGPHGVMHCKAIYEAFQAREPTWKKRLLIGKENYYTQIQFDDTNRQCIL